MTADPLPLFQQQCTMKVTGQGYEIEEDHKLNWQELGHMSDKFSCRRVETIIASSWSLCFQLSRNVQIVNLSKRGTEPHPSNSYQQNHTTMFKPLDRI